MQLNNFQIFKAFKKIEKNEDLKILANCREIGENEIGLDKFEVYENCRPLKQ